MGVTSSAIKPSKIAATVIATSSNNLMPAILSHEKARAGSLASAATFPIEFLLHGAAVRTGNVYVIPPLATDHHHLITESTSGSHDLCGSPA